MAALTVDGHDESFKDGADRVDHLKGDGVVAPGHVGVQHLLVIRQQWVVPRSLQYSLFVVVLHPSNI